MIKKVYIAALILCTSAVLVASGNIIYRDIKGAESGVQAEFTLNSPADDIWVLLTDYTHSNTIMPNIEKTTVLKKEKNKTIVETTVKQGVFTMTYTSTLQEDKANYYIKWDQLDGPFSKNSGSWKLNPVSSGKTRVIYTIELNHPLMPESVRTSLVKKSIPDMYAALKNRLN